MKENAGQLIELQVEITDRAYSDALVQTIMSRHSGISVRSSLEMKYPSSDPSDLYILRDAPGGIALYGSPAGSKEKLIGYFPSGERVSRIVERIESSSGRAPSSSGPVKDELRASCIAFISSRGGTGTSTLARTFGRLLFRDRGVRCLMLSLSPYGNGNSHGPANPVTRLYYRLMTGEKADILPLCSEERGVYTAEGRGINSESGNLDPALLEALLKAAGSCGLGYVLLDIGDHLERDRLLLLEKCSTIVSVAREGTDLASASRPASTISVYTFCRGADDREEVRKPSNMDPGRTLLIPDIGKMDEQSPPAEYCRKVRDLIRLVEMDDGKRKQKKSGGESGRSGFAAHTFGRNGQR